MLDEAVRRSEHSADEPEFVLVTVGGGGPLPGVDLDRPRELLVAENEERDG